MAAVKRNEARAKKRAVLHLTRENEPAAGWQDDPRIAHLEQT
jgi:hypothetical protein